MSIRFGLLGLCGLMTACEAFKVGSSPIDTGAVGPVAVEPGDEPSNEPSEPGDEPSNEPSDDTDTEDSEDPNALDCKWDPVYMNDLPEYQCASGRLFDGDVVDATSSGATNFFTRAHYSSVEWGCDVEFDGDYASPEHSFILVHPANGMYCDIEVETRCGDFDLIAFPYNIEENDCPIPDYPLYPQYSCEMSSKRGVGRTDSLKLYESSSEERLYLVIVDSPDPTEEWFRLSVNCCYTSSGCN